MLVMADHDEQALKWRRDFPMLTKKVHGHPLVYLDNAASSQKPQSVIERMRRFYAEEYATVNRGVYLLSQQSTSECNRVRTLAQHFIGANSSDEIIFTKGTTEAINLVAHSFGKKFLNAGDEVIISTLEHHANIVPWQMACETHGATLKVIPANDLGELDLAAYEKLLSEKTKLVAIGHASNALGTINPVAEIIQLAKKVGAYTLIDGAQAVPHFAVNVQKLDCDFYCFSAHKMFGPTGVGVLYGKKALLNQLPPYQTGGDMIESVTLEKSSFAPVPQRFEAGTPAIAEIVGLGATFEYFHSLNRELCETHEQELLNYATECLRSFPGIRIIGESKKKVAVLSFVMDKVHPHDIGTVLDEVGIAIRAGHHCAQPTMQRYGVPATARLSIAHYNTRSDIDRLMAGLQKVAKVFL